MAGEWQTLTVEEIKAPGDRTIAIGPFGSRMKADTYVAAGVPVIRGTNISDTRALVGDFVFVSDQTADELRACNVFPDDLVFPHRGAIGQVAIVPNGSASRYMLSTSLMKLTCDAQRVDPLFMFYFFRSPLGRHALLEHSSTVGTPGIGQPLTSLRSIRVPVPPLPEQRAIAHILGTLDDKIELNRRMSETLEAMARALFKSWFVDFDPVRAKMDGRWRRGTPLHSPLPAGEGSGVRAAPPDRAAVTASLPADLRDFARELRRRTTDAEALLWRLLRNRLMAGAKFRRQHPLPPYVLDFYCHDAGLAVELDGGQHNEAAGRRHDARRDAFLAQKGIRVLRFWNHEVLNQTEAVLEAIYAAIEQAPSRVEPSPPAPLPEGEGSFHLPAHLYDIFPDRLVDSELGEIPEGWEIMPIGELAEVVGGSTPKTERPEYWEGGTHHWVTPKDLSVLSMPVLLDTERKITDAGLAQISSGLLPKGTILLSSRAPIGYLAVAEVPVAVNQGFIAMKPRRSTSNLFLLRWASAAHDEIVSHANGSTFLEISKANFRPIRTVAPGGSVMEAFDRLSRPMYRKVVEHERESRTLAALRDTLLPKLISGELRVPDAERLVESKQ